MQVQAKTPRLRDKYPIRAGVNEMNQKMQRLSRVFWSGANHNEPLNSSYDLKMHFVHPFVLSSLVFFCLLFLAWLGFAMHALLHSMDRCISLGYLLMHRIARCISRSAYSIRRNACQVNRITKHLSCEDNQAKVLIERSETNTFWYASLAFPVFWSQTTSLACKRSEVCHSV